MLTEEIQAEVARLARDRWLADLRALSAARQWYQCPQCEQCWLAFRPRPCPSGCASGGRSLGILLQPVPWGAGIPRGMAADPTDPETWLAAAIDWLLRELDQQVNVQSSARPLDHGDAAE